MHPNTLCFRSWAVFPVFFLSVLLSLVCPGFRQASAAPEGSKPNVLLITIDDLNDWVGCLGGHPQTLTPNIDALAKRGVLFTNAHCGAPVCNPSRASFMSGIRPSTSGIYENSDAMTDSPVIQKAVMLPQHFSANGYRSVGTGKLFHGSSGKEYFDEYGPADGQGPTPKEKLNCPKEQAKSKLWDWGVFPEALEHYNDVTDAAWAAAQLHEATSKDKPLFLGVGFYRPHVPLYAPEGFFAMHPRNQIILPEVLDTDRSDIPKSALDLTDNDTPPSHDWFVKSGEWSHAVQAYLACISFVDSNVGTVIDALDRSALADNTWIVLFSDHGFFLGEKQRWAKQALWERATKVPLIIVPPKNLAADWATAATCPKPVDLLSIYPTLVELCGLTEQPQLQGYSLVPLLKDPAAEWTHRALTTYTQNNHAVRSERWRYIRYHDGAEELYDMQNDPHEWYNLANKPEHAALIEEMKSYLPTENVSSPPAKPSRKRRDAGE